MTGVERLGCLDALLGVVGGHPSVLRDEGLLKELEQVFGEYVAMHTRLDGVYEGVWAYKVFYDSLKQHNVGGRKE